MYTDLYTINISYLALLSHLYAVHHFSSIFVKIPRFRALSDKAYSNTHFILPGTYEAEITEFHKKRRTAYILLCYADRCAETAYITVYTYAYAYETMYTVGALYLALNGICTSFITFWSFLPKFR